MAASIAIETPLSDEVRVLVKALNAYLNPLSPPEFQFQMTVEQMAGPETVLFVARDEAGKLVALDVKKGDRVLFGKYAGTDVKIDGEDHLILREDDILGVVE